LSWAWKVNALGFIGSEMWGDTPPRQPAGYGRYGTDPLDIAQGKRKTALVPPAVRAPVFPHASPVTEGLKLAILWADPTP